MWPGWWQAGRYLADLENYQIVNKKVPRALLEHGEAKLSMARLSLAWQDDHSLSLSWLLAGLKPMGKSPWAEAHGLEPMGLSPWA